MRRECVLVDEFGQHIGVSAGRLEVRGQEETKSVPLDEVESLLLGPRAGGVSVRALLSLMGEGVTVSVLSEGGEALTLTPRSSEGLRVLRAQARWGEGSAQGAEFARRALRQKVRNQRLLVARLAQQRRHVGVRGRLLVCEERLRAREVELEGWRFQEGVSWSVCCSGLMSIEARAARVWWRALGWVLPSAFGFKGRALAGEEQDPFNAALNYGYAILVARVTQALGAQGFEPQLGFLHADAPPRASLSYDVVECYRQVFVDLPLLSLALSLGAPWELGEDGRLSVVSKRQVAGCVLGALSEETSQGAGIDIIRGDVRGLKESVLRGVSWRPQAIRF